MCVSCCCVCVCGLFRGCVVRLCVWLDINVGVGVGQFSDPLLCLPLSLSAKDMRWRGLT